MHVQFKVVPAALWLCTFDYILQSEVGAYMESHVGALRQKAKDLNLVLAGPLTFDYTDIDWDYACMMTIALPVAAPGNDAKPYQYRYVPSFKCLSGMYKGPVYQGSIRRIEEAWKDLSEQLRTRRLEGYMVREAYMNWVGPESEENLAELQAGYWDENQ